MHRDDLPILKEILSHSVDPIEVTNRDALKQTHLLKKTLKGFSELHHQQHTQQKYSMGNSWS